MLINWLFFNTLLPLSPIFFVWVCFWLFGKRKDIFEIIKDGQVCFYCVATSSIAIGDLKKASFNTDMFLIGFIAICLLSTLFYVIAISESAATEKKLQQNRFGKVSVAMVVATVLVVVSFREKAGLL